MNCLKLDISALPTYNLNTMCIIDSSIYPENFQIVSPSLEITVPGFNNNTYIFTPYTYNIFDSVKLNITSVPTPLPDGIYRLKYSVNPAYENYIEKSILRVDKLIEKYDTVFLNMELECDAKIKKETMSELQLIDTYINSAIASANNCAELEAMKLYNKASDLIDKLSNNNCNCI